MKKITMLKKIIIKTARKIEKIKNYWRTVYLRAKARSDGDDRRLIPVELDLDIYHNDGEMYLECEEYEKAIEMFKKEIECDPNYNLGYHSLGNTYQKMGRIEEARKNYLIAIKNTERMMKEYPGEVDESIIEEMRQDLESLKESENAEAL